jgi:hypothetical protein
VGVEEVKKVLLSNNNDKPPGSDNFDRTLLRIIADYIATPIFFSSLQSKPAGKCVPLEGSKCHFDPGGHL